MYKDYSKLEKNNIKHKTQIINTRNGANIGSLISEKSFNLNEFIMKRDGSFQPNTAALKLKINRGNLGLNFSGEIDLEETSLQIPTLENIDLDNAMFLNWDFESDLWLDTSIQLRDLLKKGDELVFIDVIEDESYEFFRGYLTTDPNLIIKNSYVSVSIEVKDRTYNLLDKVAKEAFFRQGWYLCNNSSKETSLLHYLAYQMGYSDNELEFEDIKYQGNYVDIPVVKIDKDSPYLTEFAEACRAIEARFHQVHNKLVVRSYLNESTIDKYEFNKTNILNSIDSKSNISNFSKVKVTYEKLQEKKEQLVWALVGEKGTVDEANIKVPANTTKENNNLWWTVDFRPSGVVASYKEPEIEATTKDGTKINLEYDLQIEKNGGKLKLLNSLDEEVYINKFHIKGAPIHYFPGNSITFPSDDTKKTNSPATNKYIQHVNIASLKAKNTYNFECRDYKRITFDTNVSRWLVPGMICSINHSDYSNENMIIESIIRNYSSCKVTLREYLPVIDAGDLQSLNQSGATEEDMQGTNMEDVVKVDPNIPPAPEIKAVEPNIGGIVVKLEEYPRGDIANFEFKLTMVNSDNTPIKDQEVLTHYYNSYLVPIMLTNKNYYGKKWQVEVRAIDLKSRFSEWSLITPKCYAIALKMSSEGIEDSSITTNKLQFGNNDAIYVDTDGYLRIKASGVLIGPDENIIDKIKDVDEKVDGKQLTLLRLNATTQIFKKDLNGNITPSTSTLTATLQNVEDTVQWKFNDGIWTDGGYSKIISNTSNFPCEISCRLKSDFSMIDKITLHLLEDGKDGSKGDIGPQGSPGKNGIDGENVYFHIAYADDANGNGFSQSPSNKNYIGTYCDNTMEDSSNPLNYDWILVKGSQGENGEDGVPGLNGTNGKTSYLHIAYADNINGGGFSQSSIGKEFMGTYVDFLISDSSDPSKYDWKKIKGDTGLQGPQGVNGVDGDKGDKGDTGPKGSNGVNAISGFLTNEAHILSCNKEGNVISYTNATGDFKVYNGTTEVNASFSVENQIGGVFSIDSNGIYKCTSLTNETALCTLKAVYSGHVITKIFSVLKGANIDAVNEISSAKAEEINKKIKAGEIVLSAKTSVYDWLKIFGVNKGIASFNGDTEATSTKKTIVDGGVIEFWEKV